MKGSGGAFWSPFYLRSSLNSPLSFPLETCPLWLSNTALWLSFPSTGGSYQREDFWKKQFSYPQGWLGPQLLSVHWRLSLQCHARTFSRIFKVARCVLRYNFKEVWKPLRDWTIWIKWGNTGAVKPSLNPDFCKYLLPEPMLVFLKPLIFF